MGSKDSLYFEIQADFGITKAPDFKFALKFLRE